MDRAEKSSWKTPVKLKTRLRCTIETKLRNDSLVCRNKSFNWTSLPSSISVSLIHHRTRLPEYRDVKHLVRWLKGSIYLNSLMYANLECRIQSQFAKAFFVALWRKHRGTTYAGMRHKQKVQFSTNCSQGIGHFLTDSQSTIRNFTVSNVIHIITFFPSLLPLALWHFIPRTSEYWQLPIISKQTIIFTLLRLALGRILVVV